MSSFPSHFQRKYFTDKAYFTRRRVYFIAVGYILMHNYPRQVLFACMFIYIFFRLWYNACNFDE